MTNQENMIIIDINKLNRKKGWARMKSTGIIRKVDELGRVVLPVELRRSLDIDVKDELEIYLDNDRIILQKFQPSCIFCASSHGLVRYHGKNVCHDCIRNLSGE